MVRPLMSPDRRNHARHPVRILVQHHENTGAPYEVDYASDLSTGGLFIKTHRVPPLGSTIHVQFAPAKDARMVEAFCRVARITPSGVGAQFVQMDPASVELLEDVIGTFDGSFLQARTAELRASA
ncbi:MAG: PilZ domain [Myxococcaceae bacterium]|nr:PilZ domain [Myxococcaceae bacterium]